MQRRNYDELGEGSKSSAMLAAGAVAALSPCAPNAPGTALSAGESAVCSESFAVWDNCSHHPPAQDESELVEIAEDAARFFVRDAGSTRARLEEQVRTDPIAAEEMKKFYENPVFGTLAIRANRIFNGYIGLRSERSASHFKEIIESGDEESIRELIRKEIGSRRGKNDWLGVALLWAAGSLTFNDVYGPPTKAESELAEIAEVALGDFAPDGAESRRARLEEQVRTDPIAAEEMKKFHENPVSGPLLTRAKRVAKGYIGLRSQGKRRAFDEAINSGNVTEVRTLLGAEFVSLHRKNDFLGMALLNAAGKLEEHEFLI